MKAIIFGSGGQDGFYLTKLLNNINCEVTGITRSDPQTFVDISSFSAVEALIGKIKPDFIFHLAAVSATSHQHLLENYSTISTGTVNILEAVKRSSPNSKVFLSGSGLQFKNKGNPIHENDELDPGSAYSLARIQSLYSARYFRTLGLKIYYGSFFNHDSPRRGERHVTQKIAAAVKRIREGSKEKIQIGNFDVRKEWGFSGDIVRGIWTFVNQDEVFECVIGTGVDYSIKEWIEACFSLIDTNWEDYVVQSPSFVPEYSVLVSDPSTLLSLGWAPEVDFNGLAKLMLSDAQH